MKHPIVQAELGLALPEAKPPLIIEHEEQEPTLTRSEAKYFYEGALWLLSEFEHIRDMQAERHGNDHITKVLDALLHSHWRTAARLKAYSHWINVQEEPASSAIPLELKGQVDD